MQALRVVVRSRPSLTLCSIYIQLGYAKNVNNQIQPKAEKRDEDEERTKTKE